MLCHQNSPKHRLFLLGNQQLFHVLELTIAVLLSFLWAFPYSFSPFIFSLCFLSFLSCFPLLLWLLARKSVPEPLAMGNKAAAWSKEPSTGTSRHSQGKCCTFPSEIPVAAQGSSPGQGWSLEGTNPQLCFGLRSGKTALLSCRSSLCFIWNKMQPVPEDYSQFEWSSGKTEFLPHSPYLKNITENFIIIEIILFAKFCP